MVGAGLWGLLGASSLVLGAIVGLALPIPEAFADGGDLTGLATVFGFAVAFLVSTLAP